MFKYLRLVPLLLLAQCGLLDQPAFDPVPFEKQTGIDLPDSMLLIADKHTQAEQDWDHYYFLRLYKKDLEALISQVNRNLCDSPHPASSACWLRSDLAYRLANTDSIIHTERYWDATLLLDEDMLVLREVKW